MTATYDGSALDDAINYIRFRIGDVGPVSFRVTDEEIEAYAPGGVVGLATNDLACVAIVRGLIARYAGVVDVSEGGASFSGSQLAAQYRALLTQLESENGVSASAVVASAIYNGDRPPAFTRQLGDREYPGWDSTAPVSS